VDLPRVHHFEPVAPAWAYKTYRMVSPPSHRRKAACAEVECERWQKGWTTYLDIADPRHAEAAHWIRARSGRAFTAKENGTGVTFSFPAGQDCFQGHTIPYKPHLLLVQGGDWRGNPRGVPTVQHHSMSDWVEDFAENQSAIHDRVKRG
jgi:hypothetical protein